ncbi:hypothetical protein [Paenibacillus sp. Soil522]|uniref:hypothetical protein n=1 Tax=Paenibacillus sp. Soil522 TaxID=1736388 RepID=UPI0006F82B8C|nr:hypothetical protein [Paenibacillus sp. Soil522]KRE53676.1 hypothetical protein ASG81_02650 [Paenibacillus sp. Soil522]
MKAKPGGMGDLLPPTPAPHYFESFIALGGRSMIWNGVTPRMHQVDIAQWPVSPAEIDSYYTIAEQVMAVKARELKPMLEQVNVGYGAS